MAEVDAAGASAPAASAAAVRAPGRRRASRTAFSAVALRAERALTGRMPYAVWAAYRIALAVAIWRVRQNRSR